jgi:hypothetical protein
MGTKEIVGLVRFPAVQPPLQNFRLNLDHTERIVLWNGEDCAPPDIAFLKIPEMDARDLEAREPYFTISGSRASLRPASPNIA